MTEQVGALAPGVSTDTMVARTIFGMVVKETPDGPMARPAGASEESGPAWARCRPTRATTPRPGHRRPLPAAVRVSRDPGRPRLGRVFRILRRQGPSADDQDRRPGARRDPRARDLRGRTRAGGSARQRPGLTPRERNPRPPPTYEPALSFRNPGQGEKTSMSFRLHLRPRPAGHHPVRRATGDARRRRTGFRRREDGHQGRQGTDTRPDALPRSGAGFDPPAPDAQRQADRLHGDGRDGRPEGREERDDGANVLRRLHGRRRRSEAAPGHLPVQRRARLRQPLAPHGLLRPDARRSSRRATRRPAAVPARRELRQSARPDRPGLRRYRRNGILEDRREGRAQGLLRNGPGRRGVLPVHPALGPGEQPLELAEVPAGRIRWDHARRSDAPRPRAQGHRLQRRDLRLLLPERLGRPERSSVFQRPRLPALLADTRGDRLAPLWCQAVAASVGRYSW